MIRNFDSHLCFSSNNPIMTLSQKKGASIFFLFSYFWIGFKKLLIHLLTSMLFCLDKEQSYSSKSVSIYKRKADFGLIYGNRQNKYLFPWLEYLKRYTLQRKISVILFLIDDLNLEADSVKGYLINRGKVQETVTSVPHYIYNLVVHSKASSVKAMRQLRTTDGITVINAVNRFHQTVMFDIIKSLGETRMLMPYTKLTPSVLLDYLDNYKTVFLLPERGIIQKKAILVEKTRHRSERCYRIRFGVNQILCTREEVYPYVKKKIQSENYMVMKGIKTLNWNGLPMEIRVYVQKGLDGHWDISGMVAKNEMFSMDSLYKNSSDDLRKVLLEQMPDKADQNLIKLRNFSKNICTYMDHFIPNLGTLSMDFVMNARGSVCLTSFSGCEQQQYLADLDNGAGLKQYLGNCLDYLFYCKYYSIQEDQEYELG